MILIGYSGHAFVVYGICKAAGLAVAGYCDSEEKIFNPYRLPYLGTENNENAIKLMAQQGCFIAVGDNGTRKRIFDQLSLKDMRLFNVIHPRSITDSSVTIAASGVMISAGVIVNSLARIGTGAICNTGCIIEHECSVGDFSHIGPGAVLCGNVTVGEGSFIGANAVIRQGISIGRNVMIGAGAVVVKNVSDSTQIIGNPGMPRPV